MKTKIDYEFVKHMYEGVYFVDINRKITTWNMGAELITGYKADEVINKHCYANILDHIDENGIALCFTGCPLHATMSDGTIREANVYLKHKNGFRVPVRVKTIPVLDENGSISGSIELFTELKSETQLRNILEKYQKESLEDKLTCIPNRRYLEAILESKLREFKTIGLIFGVAFLDIDDFKKINDTYGHDCGDEVLKLLVNTIQANLRKGDFVGRWGGEEFILVYSDINDTGLSLVTEKIRKLVSASTLKANDNEISVSISIGATLVNTLDTIDTIVKRCDQLMYQSKLNGKNRVTIG